jgi:hypothetical protein
MCFRSTFQGRELSTRFGLRIIENLHPQTTILEGRTNISECVFEALLKGVSTGFGRPNVEKCFENALSNVGSAFQNRRLGSIKLLRTHFGQVGFSLPKSSFGEHKVLSSLNRQVVGAKLRHFLFAASHHTSHQMMMCLSYSQYNDVSVKLTR